MSQKINKENLRTQIEELINKHLPAKKSEKSEFGEVFTPPVMIETLYTRYPKHVWSNPTLKWFDPCGGIGNFTLVLYFWLMDGLKNKIPNEQKRTKHILENMIYITEINATNVKTCTEIFKTISSTSKINIHQGDFLKLDPKSLKWPEKYDFIVGNPPYNIGGTGLEGSKRTHIIFTEHALNLLSNKGYLAFICPPSYREADTKMNKLFQDNKGHFVFIKIYGATETAKLFHIQGRVDGFIYQKDVSGKTIIDDEYGIISNNINIDLTRHIPNFGITIFEKLYANVKKLGNVDAFRNTELSTVKTNLFSCGGKNKVLHLIVEKGKRILKTSKKHSLANESKMLINGLGVPYVYYDSKGEYAPSQSPVIVLNPSKNLVNLLKSDFFPFVAWGLRLTGNNNLPYIFNAIPNISKDTNTYKTLNDIQKGFKLTNSEKTFIEKNFKAYEYENKDIIESCKKTKKMKGGNNKTRKRGK